MTVTTPGSKVVRGIYLAVAAVSAWMLLPHVGYSPMWDGRIYADCISAAARDQYEQWMAELPDVPALFVDVIADRPTARGIAERCGVKHESPQAILFEAGRPVWHASHDAITVGALHAAWAPRC